ncbi:MAG: 1,6-anhydro-N-acetylmuramyl-L-alanine amidase AmpD [Pseudomonadota bacterium]|jgi:AmpD protein
MVILDYLPIPSFSAHDNRLNGVAFRPSPFFNSRPPEATIDLIVIHGISLPPRQFGGDFVDQLFLGTLNTLQPEFVDLQGVEVSAHLLIRRDGQVIQYVPFDKRAWHAGKSQFRGKSNCNDFSVGIELEGCDDMPYTKEQYRQLAGILQLFQRLWNISVDRIVGHVDIAPARKTDPGAAFDWKLLRTLLS